jgi:hypothetical protein
VTRTGPGACRLTMDLYMQPTGPVPSPGEQSGAGRAGGVSWLCKVLEFSAQCSTGGSTHSKTCNVNGQCNPSPTFKMHLIRKFDGCV